jgi:trimeric autotransporter adhesin
MSTGYQTRFRNNDVKTLVWVDSQGNLSVPIPSGSGAVDSVNAGTGITVTGPATDPIVNNAGVLSVAGSAGDISSSGGQNPVIGLVATAVTPGAYTSADITVDANGRITAAANGSAGGGVASVTAGTGINVGGPATDPIVSNTGVLSVTGTASNISSTGGQNPVVDLIDTAVTPGAYTNADITIDAKGRVTAAANGATGAGVVIAGAGTNSMQYTTATAAGNFSVSLGHLSSTPNASGIAMGTSAVATGLSAVAIGSNSNAALGGGGGTGNVSIGASSLASRNSSVALGFHAQSTHDETIAIGSDSGGVAADAANATAARAIAIGTNSLASAEDTLAIGQSCEATAASAVALGQGVTNAITQTIALGTNAVLYQRMEPVGTVTQLTNNDTAVTLNASQGKITMATTLAAATRASFTLNNNRILTTSMVQLLVEATTIIDTPMLWSIVINGAGSMQINVRNLDANQPTTFPPIIHFNIYGGA